MYLTNWQLLKQSVALRIQTGNFSSCLNSRPLASPPTEECEGSHTQEEQYRLWQQATKKQKLFMFIMKNTELPKNSARFGRPAPQIPPKFLSACKPTKAITRPKSVCCVLRVVCEEKYAKFFTCAQVCTHAYTHSLSGQPSGELQEVSPVRVSCPPL